MRHKIVARLIKWLLKAILATCRIEVRGREGLEKVQGPLILLLWHNRLAPLAELLVPLMKTHAFTAFVSKSRDGEFLSQFCLTYPKGNVIRVAHNKREQALKTMIETLKRQEAVVIITPDGPRGPPYQLKPGVFFAAKEAPATLIPFSWNGSNYLELKTWDRFRVPLPFTKIKASFGAPVDPDSLNSPEELQAILNELNRTVDA